jgi:hypothetical protein
MNKAKLAVLALASVALLAPAVQAETVTSATGDLILGFDATGGTGASVNLMVNLGNIASYTNMNGATFSIPRLSLTDLSGQFGSDWNTRTDLNWGIVGAIRGTTAQYGFPVNTLFATEPLGVTHTPGTSSAQGTGRSYIGNMYTKMSGTESTANSAYSIVLTQDTADSWNNRRDAVGGLDFGYFSLVESAIEADGSSSMDLVYLKSTTAVPDGERTNLGTFTLTSSGLSFQAIPEPSSMMLVFMGLGMSVMVRRHTKLFRS